MHSVIGFTDYRDFLKAVWERRLSRNPRYSLRAYARDLGLSASGLSEVLSRRHKLSPRRAREVARKMGLTETEERHFVDLVTARAARRAEERAGAAQRISATRKSGNREQAVRLDVFELIAQWHHFAILEVLRTDLGARTVQTVAAALGLPAELARSAVRRLERLGFLKRAAAGDELVLSREHNTTPLDAPSAAIRDYHRAYLDKIAQGLETLRTEERENLTVLLAFPRGEMAEAKRLIREFRQSFCDRFRESPGKDGVHVLAIHFSEITQRGKEV